MGGQEGPHSRVDSQDEVLAVQEQQLSQKMRYLIEAEQVLRRKVQALETSMGDLQTQKKAAVDDLKSLQDAARRSRADIRRAETVTRKSVERAEDIRSELVVLEYQRDQAKRELEKIEHDVSLKARNLPSPVQQERLIRSLDNIHLMTSPSSAKHPHDSTSLRQLYSLPPQSRRIQHDYPAKRQATPSNRKEVRHSEDCLSDSSTDQSSAPPIHSLLDDSEDQEGPILSQQAEDKDHPPLTSHRGVYSQEINNNYKSVTTERQSKVFNEGKMDEAHLIEQMTAENADLRRELQDSRTKLKAAEDELDKHHQERSDRNQLMQQVSAENAELRRELENSQKKLRAAEENLHKNHQESSESRNQLQQELVDLRNQLHEKVMKLGEIEGAIQERDDTLNQVRQQLVESQENLRALQRDKEKIISEKTDECQRLESTKEAALVQLRETLLQEKEGTIRLLQLDLQKEKNDAVALLEEQLQRMKESSLSENQERNEEILNLQTKVRQLEESKESLGYQMRREAEEQIQKAVLAEREVWLTDSKQTRAREKREVEERLGGEVNRLQEEMRGMEQKTEHLKTVIDNLKEENNKLREENLAAGREKVEAVSEAREETRKDIQLQLDNMREDMTQEKIKETEKLKDRLKQQEEEILRLQSEVRVHLQREKESLLNVNVEKIDRSLIHDLNEECNKTAKLLGMPARRVQVFMNLKTSASMPLPSSSGDQLRAGQGDNYLPTRTQLHTAVTNMKETNEDLRNYAKKMKEDGRQYQMECRVKESEIEKLQSSISNDKEESRANLEEHQVEAEHLKRALHKLKTQEKHYQDQLAQKDHDMREVQRNMRSWKEETALKMAQKFEEELHRELEQKVTNLSLDGNHSNLSATRSLDVTSPSGIDSSGTLKVMRHLQDQVKQLKIENLSLKRHRNEMHDSGSQYGTKDQQIYKLNQRVKLLERQLGIAEDRCRENASQLSKSMLETSRLESALTQQTKELMRMERAYGRISKVPSPYSNV